MTQIHTNCFVKIRTICSLKFLEAKVDALKVHSFELYLSPINPSNRNSP